MRYIHYGSNCFNINKFSPIKNNPICEKPLGGLWACRVNSSRGWKEWAKNVPDFSANLKSSFIFSIRQNAKILTINNYKQLLDLPKNKNIAGYTDINFERLAEEYDAIEVLISEDHQLHYYLYGWDCDSIVIMNPDIIEIEIKHQKLQENIIDK